MAECKTDLAISDAWSDLAATYADLGGAAAFVQNKGARAILVNFSTSGSAPSDASGLVVPPDEIAYGTAAHIWVRSLGQATGAIACGLADA